MQVPASQPSVDPPRNRLAVVDDHDADDHRSPRRARGLVVDLGPIVQQPVPDWDWGPDDERRHR